MARPPLARTGRLLAAVLALAPGAAFAGPPPLPPLPGERPPEPDPAKPDPEPSTPAAKPSTPAAKPSKPAGEPTKAAAPPKAAPSSEPSTPPPPGLANEEPPQPEPSVTPPAGPPAKGDELELPSAEPIGAADRGSLPLLPPPPRPPYTGTGMFIGAGVTFAVALTEQIVAHVLVKRRCTDPVQKQLDETAANEPTDPTVDEDGNGIPDILEVPDEAEQAGELVIDCIPGVVPALALRVHSDLGLLATIGLAAAGGMLRARRAAYDDAFGRKPRRRFVGLRAAGISLIATGVVTWFSTGAGSWGWLASCDNGDCVTKARLMNFLSRDASALMVASGGALLGFAEAYRRNYDRYERDRAWSVGPAVSRTHYGFSISGRF